MFSNKGCNRFSAGVLGTKEDEDTLLGADDE
jgi:hypothetical protein